MGVLMHEFASTQELANLVLAECEKAKLSKPTQVVVELGSLTSMKAEAIQFYFEAIKSEEPRLRQCRLEIKEVQAKLHCSACGAETEVEDPYLLYCPRCPQAPVEIVCGKDFCLKSISA
jgi:hydrogenase nickel incorporation protein HypA/HybF